MDEQLLMYQTEKYKQRPADIAQYSTRETPCAKSLVYSPAKLTASVKRRL